MYSFRQRASTYLGDNPDPSRGGIRLSTDLSRDESESDEGRRGTRRPSRC